MFLVVIKAEVKSPHRAKNKVETPCVYHKSLDYVRAKIKKDDLKSHPFVVLLGIWVIDGFRPD